MKPTVDGSSRTVSVPARNGPPGLWQARLSTAGCFFVFGGLLATWVSRIPVIQHRLHLNSAQLGIALLGPPIGQVLATQLGPAAIHRFSSGTVARWSAYAAGGGLVLVGLAGSLITLAAFLAVFGLGLGALDICMNTQGVAVEREYERPIMSGLHGVYSLGVLAGASLGAGAAALDVEPPAHFAIAACLFSVVTVFGTRSLLGAGADRIVDQEAHPPSRGRRPRLIDHPMLIAVGVVAFCAFFAEGAVDNWSGVFLRQVRHSSFAIAPFGTAFTGIGMAVGRFTGDAVIARYGRRRTLLAASLVSFAGMALALAGGSIPVTIAGYGILGLGVATIVPIAFTLAGNWPGISPAWALSRATTMGYLGQLSSPALVGLIAHVTGLTWALVIPAVMLIAVAPLSRIAPAAGSDSVIVPRRPARSEG